jgi:hypothetical protein
MQYGLKQNQFTPRFFGCLKAHAVAAQIRAHGTAWVANCMKDWEPSTHMTKKEWEQTCRRVVQERVKFLLDQAK